MSPDILLICVYDTIAVPLLSRNTVGWAHIAVGGVTSCTVIADVQVEVLPFASVTDRLTVRAPTSAHVYATLAGRNVNMPPQLSVEPLLIWDDVTVALPEPSRAAVMLRHVAVGGAVSSTVTIDVQVAVLPFTSVADSKTKLAPISEQVKLVFETENVSGPLQLSVVLLLICVPVIEPVPVSSSITVISLQ